jgi:very-short-patch-repair endonuclease
MALDLPLVRLAARQHGLVLRHQAYGCGLTKQGIAHRVRHGRLVELTPTLLAIGGSPDTPLRRAMAAVLQAGHGGCLALDSAAALYGIPGYRLDPAHVWRVRDITRRENPLGIQHKTRRLPLHHMRQLQGIDVTTPSRMLADMAARLPLGQLARLVDDTWGRGLTGYHPLVTVTDELRGRGRKGIPMLRALTEERGPSYRPPASGLERRVMRLLLDRGLGRFERQVDVSDGRGWIGRVDFRHRDHPLVLEVQSELFHDGRTNRADDAVRIRRLSDAGLVVVELWEFEIWHRPDQVLELVRAGLAQARSIPRRAAA